MKVVLGPVVGYFHFEQRKAERAVAWARGSGVTACA